MSHAPLLVIGVGNPSRGDDALGPALLEALRRQGIGQDDGVELLTDFQLQVEHALDMDGRHGVLFVDAALPDRVAVAMRPGGVAGATLTRIEADDTPAAWSTHALRPQALLGVYARVQGHAAPAAWLLSIEGAHFELGADLSAPARQHLQAATALASDWLAQRRAAHAATAHRDLCGAPHGTRPRW